MVDLLITDLDEDLYKRLEQKAKEQGVSPEEKVKEMLKENSDFGISKSMLLKKARALREKTAHLQKTNTLDLLREDRDHR